MRANIRQKILANLAVFGLAVVFGLGIYAILTLMMIASRSLGFGF